MNKAKLLKAKKFLLRKRVIIPTVLVLIFAIFSIASSGPDETISVITPVYGDLSETVRATGQVTSNTDLNLSFNSSGIVRSVKAEVGDKVKNGQILASLDQGSVLASLTQARGALAGAQARLKRTLEGNTNEEIALAQVSLDQTKKTQETLLKNAYSKFLNSTLEAIPEVETNNTTAPIISGTYTGQKEGIIKLHVYPSTGGLGFSATGLTVGSGTGNTITAQPIGDSGLYIRFPTTEGFAFTDWVINIPNRKASDYLANYNAYQAALSESQSLIDQKQAELNLKKAQARTSDVDLAEADVMSAQGQVQAAQARYEDTIVRAPSQGTITQINVKYGELTDAQKTAIVLQDVERLYVEADINESNITTVKLGQTVTISFDALGSDKIFKGTVAHIDPSSVTKEGVVNYKIKVSLDEKNDIIRPGMNAEITVLARTVPNVLSVPQAAVTIRDGASYVDVITNEKRKKYKEREVKTGITGDGNLIEITEGLSADERIALRSAQ
jgi:HlyD family secretion protein